MEVFPNGATEFYKEQIRRERRAYAAVAVAPVVEIAGVVEPLGPAVGKRQGETQWKLWFKLVAWRVGGGPVQRREIMLYEFGAERPLLKVNDTIKPLTVMGFAARVLEDNELGVPHALINEHRGPVKDPELVAIAADLREPVVLKDPKLGQFTLNRALDQFEGKLAWGERSILGEIAGASVEEARDRVKVLASIVARAQEWDAWAEREVLPRVHEQVVRWAEEEPPTPAEVAENLQLVQLIVNDADSVCFVYEVGEHLGGHQALVEATIGGQVRDVQYIG